MNNQRRLGRGLEALLGRAAGASHDAADPHGSDAGGEAAERLVNLNVYEIDRNPFQPRRDFDEAALAELTESLKQHGLLQPLVVRRVEGRYQLISGERRLRAAIKAGWSDVPAQVFEADDRQMSELAIVENLQRKDLNALEKAASFQQYLDRYQCTQEELAGRLSIDRSTIANLIRLLELPEAVQAAVRGGAITPGHARALLPLGDEREQLAFCQRIQAESLSVRATEELVQEMIHRADAEPLALVSSGAQPRKPSAKRARNQQIAALEQELRSALGTKVDVKHASGGRGKIVVHFASHDEFERLRGHLCERQARGQVG